MVSRIPRHQGSNGSRRPFVVAPSRERFATVEGLSATLDAVLAVAVDDRVFAVSVHVVDYGTGRTATRPVRLSPAPGTPFLCSWRTGSRPRPGTILNDAGWSWLDRRGSTCAPRARADLAVPSAERATASTAGPAINRAIRHHHRVLVRARTQRTACRPTACGLPWSTLSCSLCALATRECCNAGRFHFDRPDCPRDRATYDYRGVINKHGFQARNLARRPSRGVRAVRPVGQSSTPHSPGQSGQRESPRVCAQCRLQRSTYQARQGHQVAS